MKIILIILLILSTQAIFFDIKSSEEQCIIEQADSIILVSGTYKLKDPMQLNTDFIVYDPHQRIILRKQRIKEGTFAFTAELPGEYKMCFNTLTPQRYHSQSIVTDRVELNYKFGLAAVDYEEIAKREHLGPLEKELRKVEDSVEDMYQNMIYLRGREESMRDTNESTNARVMWFNILSMLILIGLGVAQVIYLKNYFEKKKMI
ncbi:transmembrane emp24 domain-containing protein [Anaeramoeba ignava]|uniref:Transmembrane emp24 domain-containing protein n=1 Tax=Anaeramoeba ignava TaxID=1746090 RepID=A0A9Q0RBR1_ANAIG|nr:transmembrane emp24 domain-containing protein [Anaeramoeba ignava]|eukprot:Anaeramoba_ignava/a481502_148.p1 GENE.a481502_148~~a481502_148.p1  ORF type:complete len:204 (+),score=56.31 a481502_148:62-673(+)